MARRRIICTNIGILLIGSLGTNFSEILIENVIWKMAAICLLGLDGAVSFILFNVS